MIFYQYRFQSEQTPSVILQADNSELMKQLEDENRNLLLKIAELQEMVYQEIRENRAIAGIKYFAI